MTRQIGLSLALVIKLVAIGAALVADRPLTGAAAIILLPLVALVVGLTLGRGDRRLAALLAAATAALNTVGFPLVLWLIHHYRFEAGLTLAEIGSLAARLAIGGLLIAPAAAWLLARKPDGSMKIA